MCNRDVTACSAHSNTVILTLQRKIIRSCRFELALRHKPRVFYCHCVSCAVLQNKIRNAFWNLYIRWTLIFVVFVFIIRLKNESLSVCLSTIWTKKKILDPFTRGILQICPRCPEKVFDAIVEILDLVHLIRSFNKLKSSSYHFVEFGKHGNNIRYTGNYHLWH